MKLAKRIIILCIAAVLGAAIYNKYNLIKNIIADKAATPAERHRPLTPSFHGGIGPVGNPHEKKPLTQPMQKPSYTTAPPP